jgi:hypothetical protein
MSTYVSEVRAASIIRAVMMEAAHTSETSVDIQLRTRQYIAEDSDSHVAYFNVCLRNQITLLASYRYSLCT